MKTNLFLSFVSILFLALFSNANAATFTVDRSDDALVALCTGAVNDCTLRGAMTNANANGAGADTINFDIPGSGVKTINLTTELPEIKTSLTINGVTQTGYFGKPLIEVNGENVFNSHGFNIATPAPFADISVTIMALAINRHLYGVYSSCPPQFKCDITLLGNFIGTDASGTVALGNSTGISIQPSEDSIINIGGNGIFEGNLISGNTSINSDWGRGIEFHYDSSQFFHDNVQINILGNKIGTDFNGIAKLANSGTGVYVTEFGFQGTDLGNFLLTIGGTTAAARNIISGNDGDGIYIRCDDANIIGNYIGTNVAGNVAIPNGTNGNFFSDYAIHITAQDNGKYKIGGSADGAGNVISGNNGDGLFITTGAGGSGTAQLFVEGNYIGTNADGTAELGNDGDGVSISTATNYTVNGTIGGVTSQTRNIISGNTGGGITVGSGNISIYGNYIGTDKNGTSDLGNDYAGINVIYDGNVKIGGTVVQNNVSYDAGNLISGNNGNGIIVPDFANLPVTIKRNRIGTNIGGTSAIPNTENGIEIKNSGAIIGSDTNAADGNLISGNGENGILLDGANGNAENTKVYRNYIGTNGLGGDFLPNGQNGIKIDSSPNNLIGLAGNGTATNIISGNGERGIFITGSESTGNRIENNIIGLGIIGNDLGNTGSGVEIASGSQNFIGNSNGGNTIAFNAKGVWVHFGTDNEVRRNAIYSNDALGIDLDTAGVTPNDAGDGDNGGNRKQNFPVITVATTAAVSGSLNSVPNGNYTLDFYRVDACNASGNGEGRYYLGSTVVATDVFGDGTFNFPASLVLGQVVTATATVTNIVGADDTSEFSNCMVVTPPPTVSFSAANYTANEGAASRTIVVNRSGATGGTVSVDYATSNGTATAGQDYTEKSGTLTFASGEVVKTFNVLITNDTTDEPDETISLTLSNPTGGAALVSPSTSVLTIQDNDNPPTVSITDVSANEGNAGNTSFTFHVQLSAASGFPVSVNFATADGTANLSDYIGLSGQVNFAAGETDKTVTVSVVGDLTNEADETFFVNLSNAVNSTISDTQGVGTILNDDAAPVSIGGTIRKSDNTPLVGATLQLSGTQTAQTTTDANGRYSFANLPSGGNYTVSPSLANYTFSPVNRQYSNLTSNVSNADFTAIPAPSRQVQIIGGVAAPGQNGIITIELVSQGNEHSVAFSLDFDSSLVFNPQVVLGSGAQSATLVVNNSQTGKVGISLTLPAGQTFAAGTRQLAVITFNTIVTNTASTPINFDDTPTVREIIDGNGGEILANYVGGNIAFSNGYEADVSPRPTGNGNGSVTVSDFTQIGRFVAGLDTIPVLNVSNEFQRADSAPMNSLGNGVLTVSDFTQAGRYAAGLDTINQAGGASSASLFELADDGKLTDESLNLFKDLSGLKETAQNVVPTNVRVVNTQTSAGQQVTVSIETDSNGTENGFGFTLNYDVNKLSNPVVANGADTQAATLIPNTLQAGKVGVVLAMPFGQAIVAGTRQIVTITFNVALNASGGLTPLTFGDMPTFREVSDVNANVLQSNFQDGNINILAPTSSTVTVGGKVSDANGNPVARAQVSITLPNGERRTVLTSPFGFYRFNDIAVGESYVVSVQHKRYQFSPQIIAVFEAMENVNFTALQ